MSKNDFKPSFHTVIRCTTKMCGSTTLHNLVSCTKLFINHLSIILFIQTSIYSKFHFKSGHFLMYILYNAHLCYWKKMDNLITFNHTINATF